MRRCTLAFALVAATARADAPPAVPPPTRALIRDYFRIMAIYPDATQWRFAKTAPFFGGTLVCGEANLQNSMHRYRGFRPFYVTVYPDGIHEGAILDEDRDDPTGDERFKVKLLCGAPGKP